MTRALGAFVREEDGAITIDWVALTASLLLLGIAVVYAVYGSGVAPLVNSVNGTMKSTGSAVTLPDSPNFAAADGSEPVADYVLGWSGGHLFTPHEENGTVGDIAYTDANGDTQTLTNLTVKGESGGMNYYTNDQNQVVAVESFGSGPDEYSMTIVGEPYDYVSPAAI